MFAFLSLFCLGILIYHYIGYPALIAGIANLFPDPIKTESITPQISLIISAYNEAGVMAEKLTNSLEIAYPNLQIMVVSDGSDDDTASIVDGFADKGVQSLHDPQRRGKGAAMNRAVLHATGDILLFSDANAFYLPEAVTQLVQNFADPKVGCVTGKKTVRQAENGTATGEGEGLYWRYESAIKKWESEINSTAGVVGEMIAIRRELFQPIPRSVINDDVYLGLLTQRQGFRVVYEPNAVSWERPSLSMQDDMVRRRRMTAGRFQALFQPKWWQWHNPVGLWMLWSHKFLRLLLPFFMLGLFLGTWGQLFLVSNTFWWQLLFAGQVLFYGLALVGYWGEQTGQKWKMPAIAYYITSGNITSLHGLARYLSGTQSVLWQKANR
jgi:cellulose synthase/poly-beta-1,6-N-acetylglucosamine synthase-like glycosyltransferase